MAEIRKAVILAAGLGTRMLPATKAVPKELLPIVDRPLLQYAVEEAVASGVEEVIFVVAPGKEAIREHFSHGGRVETWAARTGNETALAAVRAPADLAHFAYVVQEEPLGIAHAVACARHLLEGEPFALVFPDDLILGSTPCLSQLVAAYRGAGSMLAVQTVADEEVSQYGIVELAAPGNSGRVARLVEKPSPGETPSRLGIVGRYILGPTIFRHIEGLQPGAKGELQITDALANQLGAGEDVYALSYEGRRFDTGRAGGYVLAGLAAGLARPELAAQLRGAVSALLAEAPQ